MNLHLPCPKATCRAFLLFAATCLLLLPSSSNAIAPPNWTINPADFQFRMDMVIRINYDTVPSNDPDNIVGVFVGAELRGVATPIDIGGQKYFFTTIYSNQYTGETLRFRAYYDPNDKIYSTNDSITFTNYAFVGNIVQPYWINIDPTFNFPPEILPILADTTLQTIPFGALNLTDHLLSLDGDPVTWSALAGPNLTASIVGDSLFVQPVSPAWTGTDSVRIIVTENTPGMLADTTYALYTVLPDYGPPVWQSIPSQTIFGGGSFAPFDLDNYLTYNGPCRAFDFVLPMPYTVQNAPILPVIAVDGSVQIQIIDPAWRGSMTIDFIVWDCDYPNERRDTTSATFSVQDDNNPQITSPPTVNYQENACSGLYDTQSADPNNAEGNGLTYTIEGGADAAKFSIDAATGVLSWFNFTPDFDVPGDANTDNQYEVTIRVTNLLNLFNEINLVVTVTQEVGGPFNPQIIGSGGTCIAGGSAMLTATGGVSYEWSTGAMTASISVVNSGAYTVTVTSSGGCTAVLSTTLNTAPTITASGNVGVVCNGTPIQLTSTPTGGSGVYTTFAWDGPNSFTSNAQNPASIPAAPGATGTYTVTVTDNAGCTASATATINVSANPAPTIVATSNSPLCVGKNLTLGSTPSGGSGTYTQYTWTGPGFTSNFRNPIGFAASLAAAGTYTVTVTDNQGCTATSTTVVVVNANPSIAALGNGPLCVGATVVLGSVVVGGSGVYPTYAWSGPSMYMSNLATPATFQAELAASGTYSVTVTDNAGCSATSSVTVSITGNPTITAMAVGPTCLGGDITLTSTPAGGSGTYTTFAWEGPDMFSRTVQSPLPFPAISAAAGTYTVTVTDNANCSATASTTIAVNTVPTIMAASNTPVCEGANMLLTSTPAGGAGAPYLFNWSGPDDYVASIQNPAGSSTTLDYAGVYQVKVTDSNGCTGTATTTVVIVPMPQVTASNNGPACIGTLVNLTANPSGGTGNYTSFNWASSPPIAPPYTANVQNPTGFLADLSKSGTYRVTVTDDAGCTATASTTLAVQNNPAPTIMAGSNGPLCPGATINLTSTPSGGSGIYLAFGWSGPNGYMGTGQNPAGFPASVAASGTYTVTVTDNKSCKNTASATVVIDPPTITASNSGGCIDPNITLTSIPAGGSGVYTMYAWEGPNTYMSSMQNPTPFPRTIAAEGTYTVTVTDNVGCTGTGTTFVQVGDIEPPTIACPGDKTLNVDNNCQVALPDWTGEATNLTDNCVSPGDIAVSQLPVPTSIVSGHNTVQIITLTADDGNGNTAPCTFNLTLKDVTKPVIQCPDDQTIEADMNCAGTVGSWTLESKMDNCTAFGSITESQDLMPNAPLSGHDGTSTVTLTANDGNGNTETCQFSVTLKDIAPPVIQCPANQTVSANANCQGEVGIRLLMSKMDNCTPSVDITENQSPASNTVMTGHNDFRTVTLTADDGNGNTADCSFTVTLKDVTPPIITCPNPTTVSCASNFPAPNTNLVTAVDNCSAVVKTHLSDSPPYDIQCINRFKVTRYYRATDVVGNSSSCSQIITVYDGTAPVFTFVPANVTVQCNSVPPVGNPTATDNCNGPVTIVFTSQTRTDGTCQDRYTLKRTWTASDICGNTRTATQIINVIDTQRPNFTSAPANITVQCDAVPDAATPTATDNCAVNVFVTYNGQTRTNGTCLNRYTLTRRWTAADNCGNTRSVSQRITVVDNGKPVFTYLPPDQTIACDAPLPPVGTPMVSDACDGTVTLLYLGQSTTNATCPSLYQIKRTWRATDVCGNSTAATQTITVVDAVAPVFVSVPNHVTIECSQAPPPLGNPVASDACGGFVQITFLGQVRTDGNCLYNYTLTRTWRADDLCGNTVTATQVITVQDSQYPTFTNAPANVTVTCANIPTVPFPLNAVDNCGSPGVTYEGQTEGPGDCTTGYVITRTWHATDQCGNVQVHEQTITVDGSSFGPPSNDRLPDTAQKTQRANHKAVGLQPNPTTDRVWIDLSDFADEAVTVSIFSDLGQLVWENRIPAVEDLLLPVSLREAGAAAGIYTVSVRSASGVVATRVVLVE
ncbi:MAG: HYR domain-containing protein [Lewinellaceae bacterium]|nr:HYR domain-containing protein [Lewinellaceae bacterium]